MDRRSIFALAVVLILGLSMTVGGPEIRHDSVDMSNENELTVRTKNAHEYEIVVDLKNDVSDKDIEAISKEVGAELLYESSADTTILHKIMVLRLDKPSVARQEEILELLRADPRVEAADINGVLQIPQSAIIGVEKQSAVPVDGDPNDPMYKFQWHMRMIHAPQAWAVTRGEGTVVAVIDTGVTHGDKTVEDLVGLEFVHPYNFLTGKPDGNDDHGHGTHVAGTIAQIPNNKIGVVGVAPRVQIMPLKVLSRHGYGSVADIAASIRYAADKGAHVINMSLGGSSPSSVMKSAVNYAHSKGVIVVCAAGNSSTPGRRGKVGYPAAYKNAVAVSSVDTNGDLAFYSSWGPEVAIAAPGGDSRSDKNGDGMADGVLQNTVTPSDLNKKDFYGLFQGTSMAAPHVAGVAALVRSQGVTDPDEILKVMQQTSTKKDNEEKFGAGIVDAYRSASKVQVADITGTVLVFGLFGAGLAGAAVVKSLQEGGR